MVRDLDASRLTVRLADKRSTLPPKDQLAFGKHFTDHMLEMEWTQTDGWGAPSIEPFHNVELHPAASSLHYALSAFEGMKAYRAVDGSLRLFRPDMNMARFNRSNERLYLPPFSSDAMIDLIKRFVRTEEYMIPDGEGYSLYLRPTSFSTHPFLGVGPAVSAKIMVIASPVGPYYPRGFVPVALLADPKNVRAFPGGTGASKISGNYAPGIGPAMDAAAKGYDQVLWLLNDVVSEVGTMNIMFLWRKPDGTPELVTCPLDGTVLPGVTRDSVLQLAREWGEVEVSERHFTIHEVIEAVEQGRMIEAFGVGTAAVVSPVSRIGFEGRDYEIPLDKDDASAQIGPFTKRCADTIMGIQYGRIEHEWSVRVD